MSVQKVPGPQDPPVVREFKSLIRIARLIPTPIAPLEAGHVEASMKLGKRRLPDGREAELWLVAKAPGRDETPLVRGRE